MVRTTEVEPPVCGAEEARVRVEAIGICGSDLHTFQGEHPFVSYPVWPGHELVGVVEEVGTATDRAWIGMRVALEPSLPCGTCRTCREGRYNICENLRVLGFQAPGGMAESFVVAADRLHPLPESLSVEGGALVEPMAVAVHAARLPGPLAALRVGVIGGGTIGLLTAVAATAYGAASVSVADLLAPRREVAEALGLHAGAGLEPGSCDVVFECVGTEGALRASVDACAKGGTVVVAGVYGSDPTVQAGLVQDRELRLQGSLMYVTSDVRDAIRLLAEGRVDPTRIVTHRFPLDRVAEAFEVAGARGEALKVLLLP
ncbi:MAG: alcohol dehydrogenase catalytic domain-containing protein [Deinococcales bacterium]